MIREQILSLIAESPTSNVSVREMQTATRASAAALTNELRAMRADGLIVKTTIDRDGSAIYRLATAGENPLAMPRSWDGN